MDTINFNEWISSQPRLFATKHEKDITNATDESTAQSSSSLTDFLASQSTIPPLDKKTRSRKQRFADLAADSKKNNNLAADSEVLYQTVKVHYKAAAKAIDAATLDKDDKSSSDDIKDPLIRKKKGGQQRTKRYKASGETTKKRWTKTTTDEEQGKQKDKEVQKKVKGKEKKQEVLKRKGKKVKEVLPKIYNTRLASKKT
jgi:hypothetical protein